MIIREYRSEDYEQIVALWLKTGLGNPERGDDQKQIERTLNMGGKFLVMENEEKKIIGTAWITNDGRRLYLHHFGILPEYQQQGLSNPLTEKCLEYAEQLNMQIKLEVHKNNNKAISLYKKFGFKLYGFIIMPDHLHEIIDTCGKKPIQKIFEDMDKYIARQVLSDLKAMNHTILHKLAIATSPRYGHKRQEYRLFQKGDYDFQIITPKKLIEKLKYMHENPMRVKLVEKPEDYPFSSARNYILEDNSLIRLDELPV